MSKEDMQALWNELSRNSGAGYVFPDAPRIVGWAVFTSDIESAAIYNLEQREQAFEAVKAWGASMVALCQHPESPDLMQTRESE